MELCLTDVAEYARQCGLEAKEDEYTGSLVMGLGIEGQSDDARIACVRNHDYLFPLIEELVGPSCSLPPPLACMYPWGGDRHRIVFVAELSDLDPVFAWCRGLVELHFTDPEDLKRAEQAGGGDDRA